ncbi:hypothetical protein [Kitasatospora sp. NPDC057015]|uniref:hypothetical protein n=1 Tax=Kitasatospora sp. NPDC057015 TaxID=3346001 RepID=UPI00362578B6
MTPPVTGRSTPGSSTPGGGRAGSGGALADARPPLRGRPALRRSVGAVLALCAVFTLAVAGWGVFALMRDHTPPETDLSRAERLAGLHPSQHPGKGRYYVPDEAVLTLAADGTPTGYLHYRLDGGQDVNLDDFLRTYGLPAPGAPAALPPDLVAALPGEQPAAAPALPATAGGDGRRQVYAAPADGGPAGAADVYVRATG